MSLAPDTATYAASLNAVIRQSSGIDSASARLLDQPHDDQLTITCKTDVNSLRGFVRRELMLVNEAVLAFSSTFNAFFDDLHKFSSKIDTDHKARLDLEHCLQELKREIGIQKNKSISL